MIPWNPLAMMIVRLWMLHSTLLAKTFPGRSRARKRVLQEAQWKVNVIKRCRNHAWTFTQAKQFWWKENAWMISHVVVNRSATKKIKYQIRFEIFQIFRNWVTGQPKMHRPTYLASSNKILFPNEITVTGLTVKRQMNQ